MLSLDILSSKFQVLGSLEMFEKLSCEQIIKLSELESNNGKNFGSETRKNKMLFERDEIVTLLSVLSFLIPKSSNGFEK